MNKTLKQVFSDSAPLTDLDILEDVGTTHYVIDLSNESPQLRAMNPISNRVSSSVRIQWPLVKRELRPFVAGAVIAHCQSVECDGIDINSVPAGVELICATIPESMMPVVVITWISARVVYIIKELQLHYPDLLILYRSDENRGYDRVANLVFEGVHHHTSNLFVSLPIHINYDKDAYTYTINCPQYVQIPHDHQMDDSDLDYARRAYNLIIGEPT